MNPMRPLLGIAACAALLTACDSLPGALDESNDGGGGTPPATKAYIRLVDHGPTVRVDSLVGGECPYEPLPTDSLHYVFTLEAPNARVQQVPGDRCFDYTVFVTLPNPAYVGPMGNYRLTPTPGDTITIDIYDPV